MATTSRDEEAADDLLAAALAYAAAGLRVFPLKPHSKVPATVDGFKSATTDAEQVRDWWARWPDANVAIATGAESGIVALDVDAQHGGAGTLAELEREHGKMPRPHTLTGGGGNHYLFAHPGGVVRNSAGTLGHGLDVRGDGGYIVAPPSVHENGRRYVELRPFAKREPMPGWLVEDATKRNGSTPPVVGTIRNGERNTTLTSLAGTMRRRGMSEEAILAALRATPCETPLPVAELATIARSVSRYSPSVAVAAIAWERLSRVELRSIVFIDKPLWQADAFHLVAGRKGQGKGTLLALHAAAVTRGEFGSNPNVVWIASEDSAAIDIGPRLLVAGADLERVLIVKRGWIQLPRDLDEIGRRSPSWARSDSWSSTRSPTTSPARTATARKSGRRSARSTSSQTITAAWSSASAT